MTDKFARCGAEQADGTVCNKTALGCRVFGRDTGRACCPRCTHENGWRP